MSLRKLLLHTDARLAFVSLILYAECNEFRALSRACGLTELTVAFLRDLRLSRVLACFFHFLCLHFYAYTVVSTVLYTETIKLPAAPFNL